MSNQAHRLHQDVLGLLSRLEADGPNGGDALARELPNLRNLATELGTLATEQARHERSQAELSQVTTQLESLVSAMPVILWSVAVDGTITLSEGRALAELGLRGGQLVGASVFTVYADFPDATDAIRRALRGESLAAEVEVGGRIWSNRYFPQRTETGEITGLIGLSIDVTENKRLEREAKKLQEQMLHAQRLESLGVLAGGIAHDFNNLLSVILGNVELARRGAEAGSRAMTNLESAERAAVRASELTHQLLVYAGRGQVSVSALDLDALVEEMAKLLGTVISKNTTIELELHRQLPFVEADAAQIRQVVMNLITNASDALGGTEGTIRLRTGVAVLEPDERSERAAAPHVFLKVSDTGCGMDEATRLRIFEPFFTTKVQGRGLGLAAVLGIIRGHGGTLDVDSAPGEGTTFRVQLPCAKREKASARARTRASFSAAAAGAGTILLVDDEPDVRRLLSDILVEGGFGVLAAGSGAEALALVDLHVGRIGVAVVDVMMPGMSGRELVAELRARHPSMPVVVISGYEHPNGRESGGVSEPMRFLAKPFTGDALLDAVAAAVEADADRSTA